MIKVVLVLPHNVKGRTFGVVWKMNQVGLQGPCAGAELVPDNVGQQHSTDIKASLERPRV